MRTQAEDIFIVPGHRGSWLFTNHTFWLTLQNTSADVAQSSANDIWMFADRCLLHASIFNSKITPQRGEQAAPSGRDGSAYTNGVHSVFVENSIETDEVSSDEQVDEDLDPEMPRLYEPRGPSGLRTMNYDQLAVGVVFVTAPAESVAGHESACNGVVNVIVAVTPENQRRGYAGQALRLVLQWVFEELHFHRVQARVLDCRRTHDIMNTFVKAGFTIEGTHRSAFFDPCDSIWKDVICLAMLDTDWLMRDHFQKDHTSAFDNLISRQAREHRDLIQIFNRNRVKRSGSRETVRRSAQKDGEDTAECEDRSHLATDSTSDLYGFPFDLSQSACNPSEPPHSDSAMLDESDRESSSTHFTPARHSPSSWSPCSSVRSMSPLSSSPPLSAGSFIEHDDASETSSQWHLLDESDDSYSEGLGPTSSELH